MNDNLGFTIGLSIVLGIIGIITIIFVTISIIRVSEDNTYERKRKKYYNTKKYNRRK